MISLTQMEKQIVKAIREDSKLPLASDVDTVLNNVAEHHNKSVANGTYYDNHPEIDRPDF